MARLVVACAAAWAAAAWAASLSGQPTDAAGAAAADSGAAALSFYASHFETTPTAAALSAMGRALFFDPSLSAAATRSCASCHDPRHAFGPADGAAVERGGIDGMQPGLRAVPSLEYLQNVPPFSEHFVDDEGDDSIDQGPAGGFNWDGRSASAHEQARIPLLSPFEMANAGADAVVAKVAAGTHAAQFRETFGAHVFADAALAFKGVLLALETYQQEPTEFHPYTSKYDAWLRHQASLSAEERRGLDAFNDPARGNCARCHPSAMRQGALPQFTDFGYIALGVPRNAAIPANADPRYHDLGLCGPLRTDLTAHGEYCGMFRTPSLRNVAIRRVFFHNGVVHRLADAVRFYAERDTHPEKWYPRTSGVIRVFDDLPAEYHANVDRIAPFDRRPGDPPALSAADVAAIVDFLKTLTDGYVVGWKNQAQAVQSSELKARP